MQAVAPQIAITDPREVANAGIRSVICNRPDDESPEHPGFGEIERAAVEHGLQLRYLPASVTSSTTARPPSRWSMRPTKC